MSDPYERVKGGRLTFRDGSLAARKSIGKKSKKHKKDKEKIDGADGSQPSTVDVEAVAVDVAAAPAADGADIYSIDAAKKKKYEELFPVECKKFGYVPKSNFKSVEDALDDRVKKKADRYYPIFAHEHDRRPY